MTKQTGKSPVPYAILGTDQEMNLRFYERYDENFLFNKVATFLYIIDEGEPAIKQIEMRLMQNGGGSFSERYLESIQAEIFFTALHQCETFFALLIALMICFKVWYTVLVFMRKPKAIIFDADGTLLDSFELIVAAYRHVAEVHNLRIPTAEEIQAQLGKSVSDIYRSLYPSCSVDDLLQTNGEFIAANVMNTQAFEGVDEVLFALHARNLKLAILTSGSHKVINILQHHGLEKYFSSIVYHERIQRPKPDPEGFYLAAQECGISPEEAVMVGDMVVDILAGKNAGALATIGITHGCGRFDDLKKAGADVIVRDLRGVRRVIEELDSGSYCEVSSSRGAEALESD